MKEPSQTIAILSDIIAYPTISSESNLALVEYLANYLEQRGAKVACFADISGRKANVFATLGPECDGGVIFSGHTDVVPVVGQPWHSDPFMLRTVDERLYGRGSCDMKGFIATSLGVLDVVDAGKLQRPIHFAFTYDEEVGCLGAAALVKEIQTMAVVPNRVIVGEPTLMQSVIGHKGCNAYTTYFTGLAGHASLPNKGVSATEYAIRFGKKLLEIHEDCQGRAAENSKYTPAWTTINIGKICGGHAHNVIADAAQIDWEMRPLNQADSAYVHNAITALCKQSLLPEMRKVYPDAMITTKTVSEVEIFQPMGENLAALLVGQLLGKRTEDVVSFATEAGLFQSLDTSVVVCGPGSIEQAHQANEFVTASQLQQSFDMLQGVAYSLYE